MIGEGKRETVSVEQVRGERAEAQSTNLGQARAVRIVVRDYHVE